MLELIETGLTLADRVIRGVEELKKIKISRKTLLRSYYFEVTTNLELLNVINIEMLKTLSVNSPAVNSVFQNLEIQIGAYILFSEEKKANDLFEFLNATDNVEETEDETADDRQKKKELKSVKKAIDFTIRKITILQKLSSMKSEADAEIIKEIRLKMRVENIIANLELISKKLYDFNKNENFLV